VKKVKSVMSGGNDIVRSAAILYDKYYYDIKFRFVRDAAAIGDV